MFNRKESHPSCLRFVFLLIPFVLLTPFNLYSETGETMFGWLNWFKKKEAYLCPVVNGVIKEQGLPLAHIQVTRQLIYIDEVERIDHTTTDEQGRFTFPEKTIMSRLAANPMAEQRVSQHIYVERDNKKYQLWGTSQTAYQEVPEFSKKLAFLECDLTNRMFSFEFKKEGFNRKYVSTSICTWEDGDYKPFMLYDHDGKKYYINNGDLNDLTERKR